MLHSIPSKSLVLAPKKRSKEEIRSSFRARGIIGPCITAFGKCLRCEPAATSPPLSLAVPRRAMVLEGQVSYRQVGTNKSLGRVATQKRRRVRPHRSTPSIPSKFETTLHFGRSERNGFGGRTFRFQKDHQKADVPAPGRCSTGSCSRAWTRSGVPSAVAPASCQPSRSGARTWRRGCRRAALPSFPNGFLPINVWARCSRRNLGHIASPGRDTNKVICAV